MCPAPAVIETEETDLPWAGLWYRASHPQDLGASGKWCVTGLGEGPLASVVCVPTVLVSVPWPGQCRRLHPASVSTLAQQSRYLCGAVQAQAHSCPVSLIY